MISHFRTSTCPIMPFHYILVCSLLISLIWGLDVPLESRGGFLAKLSRMRLAKHSPPLTPPHFALLPSTFLTADKNINKSKWSQRPIDCDSNHSCAEGLHCRSCLDGHEVCLERASGHCCGCVDHFTNTNLSFCWSCPRAQNCHLHIPNYCDSTVHSDGLLSPFLMAMLIVALFVGVGMIILGCAIWFDYFDDDLKQHESYFAAGPPVVVFSGGQQRRRMERKVTNGKYEDLHEEDPSVSENIIDRKYPSYVYAFEDAKRSVNKSSNEAAPLLDRHEHH